MATAAARRALFRFSGKRPAGGKCNLKARSVQANPNKTKQKSLDFLGFIRPNRDFSMGYGKKIKKSTRVSSCMQNVSTRSRLVFIVRRAAPFPTLAKENLVA
jgi:hypothetical protein